jgi:hypothetical protein
MAAWLAHQLDRPREYGSCPPLSRGEFARDRTALPLVLRADLARDRTALPLPRTELKAAAREGCAPSERLGPRHATTCLDIQSSIVIFT